MVYRRGVVEKIMRRPSNISTGFENILIGVSMVGLSLRDRGQGFPGASANIKDMSAIIEVTQQDT